MKDIMFATFLIGFVIYAAIMYMKMILIWHDVMKKRVEEMKKEWLTVNELYLKIVGDCGELPIKDPTIEQMFKRIRNVK